MSAQLTAARLRALLTYDPATGEFHRLVALRGGRRGLIASSPFKNGYRYINVNGHRYLAHRLAWLYVHGEWPQHDVDHINLNRADNRIENLRAVTREVNNQNRTRARTDNRSGRLGVSWYSRSKCWRARVMVRGREHRLGLFDDPDQAHRAYIKAKRALHEGCTL